MRTQIIKSLNQEEEGAQRWNGYFVMQINMKNKIVESFWNTILLFT